MAATRKPLSLLILAAGLGKRMKSARIKLLHEAAGRPIIDYVLDAAAGLPASRRIVVLGNQADLLRDRFEGSGFEVVIQREQRGTGHAVLQAARILERARGEVLILNGDLPGILPATLSRFVAAHRRSGAAGSLLTARLADPTGYGRIVRDEAGAFQRVVEHADASAAVRRIDEINTGIYCFAAGPLFRHLRRLRPANRQREYYLPDVLAALLKSGAKVRAVEHADAWEILGVNSRADLAEASRRITARRVAALMDSGVTVVDPASLRIGPDVRVGRDTVIHPNVQLDGATRIGSGATIGAGVVASGCRIGDGATVLPYSVLSDAVVGEGARVGPFAHLRPGTVLDPGVHIGNFVELKKTRMGRGSKANHLSYLGDAEIGGAVNVGAGTITCNYDGVHKHRTVIEEGAFIGSDAALVAPVTVGRGAYIGAGSTITENVPPGALALARGRQRNIEDWVERKKSERDKPAGRGKASE